LGVALGAFGAHWLQGAIPRWVSDPAEQAKRLQTWEIGVRYQMYHALALVLLGLLASRANSSLWNVSGSCFLAGTLLFSGLLYALTLSGVKVLGAIVPFGGTLLIVGWGALLAAAWLAPSDASP
jgi:uncharacterized membrane protein YgdD (TMEM256/DUF423 family)